MKKLSTLLVAGFLSVAAMATLPSCHNSSSSGGGSSSNGSQAAVDSSIVGYKAVTADGNTTLSFDNASAWTLNSTVMDATGTPTGEVMTYNGTYTVVADGDNYKATGTMDFGGENAPFEVVYSVANGTCTLVSLSQYGTEDTYSGWTLTK